MLGLFAVGRHSMGKSDDVIVVCYIHDGTMQFSKRMKTR